MTADAIETRVVGILQLIEQGRAYHGRRCGILTIGTTAIVNWLFTYLPAMPLVAACSLLVIAGSFWPLLDSLIGRKRAERSIVTEAPISAAAAAQGIQKRPERAGDHEQ